MEQNKTNPIYESIHVFTKRKIFSERELRKKVGNGEVPGIQTAKGFKINVPLFLAQLDSVSLDNAAGGAAL